MIETIRVELHCHSSLSDGDHPPAYVAHSIAAIGAEWGALTDHNTLSGQHQFRAVLEKRGVRSLVGLEMDARSRAGILHLLGYGLDPENRPLLDALRTLRQPWRASARYWIDKLRFASRSQNDFTAGQATADHPRSPHRPPTTAQVIQLLHAAGGLVFLAHPLTGIGTVSNLEAVLAWLQPEGLDGIEVFHKRYSPETQDALLDVALHRGLLTIAGSDFHGIHHSDGDTLGVDMPLVHWKEFETAMGYRRQSVATSPYADRPAI